MRTLFREYGALGALVCIGVAGYFVFENWQDDTSLDTIRGHLLAMVVEDGQQDDLNAHFAAFESRAASAGIRPGELELMAQNLKELRENQTELSSDEIRLILLVSQHETILDSMAIRPAILGKLETLEAKGFDTGLDLDSLKELEFPERHADEYRPNPTSDENPQPAPVGNGDG